jgi:hypothetical protein
MYQSQSQEEGDALEKQHGLAISMIKAEMYRQKCSYNIPRRLSCTRALSIH